MKFFTFAENYRRYGDSVNSHDLAKTIAVLLMIVDHIGFFFFPYDLEWRAVGRICVPIWFFMAGYAKPSRDSTELKILALLMVVADIVMVEPLFPLSVLVSVLVCRAFVRAAHEKEFRPVFFPVVILFVLVWYLPAKLLFEYGSLGIIFAYSGYLARQYPGSVSAKLCIMLCGVIFIADQQFVIFNFSIPQFLLMATGVILICGWLAFFSTRPIKSIPDGPVGVFVRFTGRNTLYIYFLHYVAFEIARYLLKAPPDFHIRFLK